MSAADELVRHALDYPFALPQASVLFTPTGMLSLRAAPGPLDNWLVSAPAAQDALLGEFVSDIGARMPTLTYGSNATHDTLRRKLGRDGGVVPLLRVRLADIDVVYSAHIAAYGSIPATLQRSQGTVALVHVGLFTPQQLMVIHETEPNYRFASLRSLDAQGEGGLAWDNVFAYISRHGCLTLGDGHLLALASIDAENRTFPTGDQRRAVLAAIEILGLEKSVEEFVANAVESPQAVRSWTRTLATRATAFEWPDWEPIE